MNTIKPEKKNLTSDLLAGLTFALVNIPQAMAHALLATVNPVFGLYTLMLATPVGALFTSAIFMNISTTSALAVAAGDTLITYPESFRGTVLVTLVLLIGIFQINPGSVSPGLGNSLYPFFGDDRLHDRGSRDDHYWSARRFDRLLQLILRQNCPGSGSGGKPAIDTLGDSSDWFADDCADLWAGKDALIQVFTYFGPRAVFRSSLLVELFLHHRY